MSTVGQIEKKTQQRVVKLFRDALHYDYLGDWTDREGNANIEEGLLHSWLKKRGVDDTLITRALYALDKAAGNTSKSLYDRNRAVYDLLRYEARDIDQSITSQATRPLQTRGRIRSGFRRAGQ